MAHLTRIDLPDSDLLFEDRIQINNESDHAVELFYEGEKKLTIPEQCTVVLTLSKDNLRVCSPHDNQLEYQIKEDIDGMLITVRGVK